MRVIRASDKKLHDALEAAGLHELAQRAIAGEWNDYFGEHDMPQHALLYELRQHPNTDELQRRVINGDFDGTRAEAEEWARSPEGRQALQLETPL